LFYEDSDALNLAQRIVAEFGYGGPGHIDFVRDDATGEAFALEFNCRFWYSTTVSLWRGGNFPALAVELAGNRPIPPRPTRAGAYFQPGTVVRCMLTAPSRLGKMDAANWQGFFQAASDPLPHLMSRFL
jgi:biotin carboxylase